MSFERDVDGGVIKSTTDSRNAMAAAAAAADAGESTNLITVNGRTSQVIAGGRGDWRK